MAITDGTALSGLPTGSRASLGGQTIVARDSAAFLPDGTIAGSVLSMDRAFRMLVIIDEHTRECLAIDVARKLTSEDLLERLSDLFICRGVPDYVRSDNGPEFTAHRVRDWLQTVEVKTSW